MQAASTDPELAAAAAEASAKELNIVHEKNQCATAWTARGKQRARATE